MTFLTSNRGGRKQTAEIKITKEDFKFVYSLTNDGFVYCFDFNKSLYSSILIFLRGSEWL